MWPVKALQQIGSGGYIMVVWCLLDPSWVGIAVWSSHNTRRDSKAAGYGKSSRTWGIHSCSISVVSYANVKSQFCALLAWTGILATAWIEDIILVTFVLQNIFLSRPLTISTLLHRLHWHMKGSGRKSLPGLMMTNFDKNFLSCCPDLFCLLVYRSRSV
jgi:hypothetical protein